MPAPNNATGLLESHVGGDPTVAEKLVPLIYEELRALAGQLMMGENPKHTLQATALVHEVYLRLIDQSRINWTGKAHFKALAAMAMKRVLINHARDGKAQKRGGGNRSVLLTDNHLLVSGASIDLLDLTDALEKLSSESPRKAQVVELRFFSGLTVDEVATHLGLSRDTIKSDWRAARAWLNIELTRGERKDER